jgi:hypothetical protein
MPYALALLTAQGDAEMYPEGSVTIEQDTDNSRLVMRDARGIMGFYPYK